MPVDATIHAVTANTWTALNAGQTALSTLSLYHKGGGPLLILVSTSSSAPTYNQSSIDDAFELRPGQSIIGTTCSELAPGLTSPSYLYAAPAEGVAGSVKLSSA